MKYLILVITMVVATLANSTTWAGGYQNVRGYIRSNGTIVSPYIRSIPDGNPYNNLSSSLTEKEGSKYAYVRVRGYFRRNGTYVRPHYRTYPDGIRWNNLRSFNDVNIMQSPFNPDAKSNFSKLV